MGFIEAYKRLEKLCTELYGDRARDLYGVKAYIEQMNNTPMGPYSVPGWDADRKKLKHYKWVRNQISHDPECTEENMCEPGDAQWLEQFHSRILTGNDPLTLCRKANNPSPAPRLRRAYTPSAYPPPQARNAGCLAGVILVLMLAGAVVAAFAIS